MMEVGFGIVVIGLSLLCWGGQTISWLAPSTAVRLGLMEAEDDVEPVYWADIRGEALWDALAVWTMVVAGVLLVLDRGAWVYFGLVGGGMYLYFAGRGVLTRLIMLRGGFRIGSANSVKVGLTLLVVWGVMGLAAIVSAVVELES